MKHTYRIFATRSGIFAAHIDTIVYLTKAELNSQIDGLFLAGFQSVTAYTLD